jgi:hypothetical protein
MAAEDSTTWGEVCKNVGFRDNLYRVCRDKVPDFTGTAGLAVRSAEDDRDFDKQLSKRALPIPEPPGADWEPEDDGNFFSEMFEDFTAEKLVIYGGLAAAIWWFFLREDPAKAAQLPAGSATSTTTQNARARAA